MFKHTLPVIIFIALLWAPLAGAKEYYRWIDKDGNTSYSEIAPDSAVTSEKVRISTPSGRTPEPTQENATDQKESATDLAAQKEKEKREAEVREIVQKNCDIAKHNLSVFQNPATKLIKNPDGSFEKLTDEVRESKSREAEEQIKEYCHEEEK